MIGRTHVYIISLALLMVSKQAISQSDLDIEMHSNSGLEYNVFRASGLDAAYEVPSGLNVIRSGIVYSNDLRLKYKRKINRHGLSLYTNFNHWYYPQISEANQLRPRFKLLYSFKPSGKHKFYASAVWKRYGSMRIDDQEDEFFIQRSFEKSQAYLRHYFTVNRRFKLRTNLSFTRSQFVSTSNQLQYYNEWTSSVRIDQLLSKQKHVEHRIKLDFEYTLRKNFSSSQESPRRIRNFLSGQISYRLELRKWTILSGISATERTEFIESNLGYHQYGMFSKLGFKSKKSEFSTRVSYTHRSYKTQFGSIRKSSLVRNNYLRIETRFTYEIRKKLSLIVKGDFIEKTASVFHSSRIFQPYLNGGISMGFKLDLL